MFGWLRERVHNPFAFAIAAGVSAGIVFTDAVPLRGLVPLLWFIGAYLFLSTEHTDAPTTETHVSGVVTQTIPPTDLSSYAIYGDLREYAERNDLTLHTIRTDYKTRWDAKLAELPLLGRLARAEAEHVAAPEPLPEGERVELAVEPAFTERFAGVMEVSG